MPVIIFEDPEMFLNDDSPVHKILEENGFGRGEYPVASHMPPVILLPELNDDAIDQLREFAGVIVRKDDD